MWRSLRAGLVCILCGIAAPASAQTARSGGGESQRMIQQYQQLAAEKTALETQVSALKHDLEAANTQLSAVKKERDTIKAHTTTVGANVAALTAAKETAEKSTQQTKDRLNELVARFRDTATELKQIESDREQLRSQLHDRSVAYDQCAADNLSLYEINGEVLNRYEHVGLFTRVAAVEPFTRITRTRIENLVDQYRTRALELRAKSNAAAARDNGGAKPPSRP